MQPEIALATRLLKTILLRSITTTCEHGDYIHAIKPDWKDQIGRVFPNVVPIVQDIINQIADDRLSFHTMIWSCYGGFEVNDIILSDDTPFIIAISKTDDVHNLLACKNKI